MNHISFTAPRVMLAMKTDDERIVAVLHDVVEDTRVTCDDFYWTLGFRPDIVGRPYPTGPGNHSEISGQSPLGHYGIFSQCRIPETAVSLM